MKYASLIVFALAFFCLFTVGCTSFRSTIMQRNDNDQLFAQNSPRSTRGVPVRLKVPSHLEVIVYESYQIVPGIKKGENIEAPMLRTLETGVHRRVMDVKTNLEYTEKVFTVDFPRPFAGSLTLGNEAGEGLVFDGEQYFSAVRGAIDDDTLEDINSIVTGQLTTLTELKNGAEKSSTASRPSPVGDTTSVNIQQRVVAYKRFDINECGWEQSVQDFIDQHLNQCNQEGCGHVLGAHVVSERTQSLREIAKENKGDMVANSYNNPPKVLIRK